MNNNKVAARARGNELTCGKSAKLSAYKRPIDKDVNAKEECGCGWTGKRIETILESVKDSGSQYVLRCPNCKKIIKIIDQKFLWKNVF